MTERQKLDKIQEVLSTVLAIVSIRILFIFLLGITPLANYIGMQYENQYYNNYIYAEGKTSSYILEETQKSLDNIPQSLVSFFYKNGGMVNVTNEEYESTYTYKNDVIKFNVAGYFRHADNEENSITIMTDLYNIQNGTVEHEFGHYLDSLFDDISEKEIFNSIYLEEYKSFKSNIESSNYYDNNVEYFAESFSKYLTEPKELKKYCPKTYDFIEYLMDIIGK